MSSEEQPTQDMIAEVRRVAEVGGREALRFFRAPLDVDNKAGPGAFDPVTEGDRAAETAMRRAIEATYPEHGILGEEHAEKTTDGPWRWVLDPIDGTRGFICGTPTWTSLVALEYAGVPRVGVIHQAYTQEAWVGHPAGTYHYDARGERAARVSAVTALAEARLQTTDPRATPAGYFTPEEAGTFDRLATRCRVARFGHDAYAYGLLALGQADLVVETSLKHHDLAALVPVVRGAGGVISDWRGGASWAEGRVVAAATAELHAAALELLSAVP